ncbi:MAG: hypothetical protein ACHQ7M_11205, partial [Chloroflexota bacterium]
MALIEAKAEHLPPAHGLQQGSAYAAAGGGVKTNLLCFTKGRPTRQVWYYDLSDVKVSKTRPLTLAHLEEFFRLLPARADSDHRWTVPIAAIKERN